ncbi:HGxxPAAW family protein [Isoptericola rhizosphaerae]|uniref:HGxxPAAW family protein n=1 Tax=Isoptericola rhizosphaerae TaxID=3377837 RepID=UPI00383B9A35
MTDNSPAEPMYLPTAVPPTNHGHTVAAWTAMIGIIAGALVSAVGCLPGVPFLLFWAGLVIVAASCVAGVVLRNMGYGQAKDGVEPRRAPTSR